MTDKKMNSELSTYSISRYIWVHSDDMNKRSWLRNQPKKVIVEIAKMKGIYSEKKTKDLFVEKIYKMRWEKWKKQKNSKQKNKSWKNEEMNYIKKP